MSPFKSLQAGVVVALAALVGAAVVPVAGASPMTVSALSSNSACPTAEASTATSCTFSTGGSKYQFTVPSRVSSLDVVAVGAAGGGGYGGSGGAGASVEDSALTVTSGEVLDVWVGSAGGNGGGGAGGAGGTPGGGAGGNYSSGLATSRVYGGGGGGYSGVLADATSSPLVIAGGGGGGGYYPAGGNADIGSGAGSGGGGLDSAGGGGGGTAQAGGTGGAGTDGAASGAPGASLSGGAGGAANSIQNTSGGGGGGGYYGGGGGGGSAGGAAGGGGSSYGLGGLTNETTAGVSPEVVISWVPPACVSWTGAAGDGNWSTAGNWSTGAVPASTDDVCITGSGTVKLTSATTVGSLKLGQSGGTEPTLEVATVNYTNVVLTATSGITNYGTIDLTSATNYQPYESGLAGGAITNESGGTIAVQSGDGVNGDCCGSRSISNALVNQGTLSIGYTVTFGTGAISNSGLITIADGTHISVPSGGSFDQQSGGSITTTGVGYLDDSGGLTIGGGTMSGDPVHLESSGTLAYAVANPSQAGTSSDVIRYGGSGVTGTLSGDIPVGSTLAIATTNYTNAELNASAPYTNYGTIDLTSATNYQPYASTLSGAALTNASGGTIAVQSGDGVNGDCCGSRSISNALVNQGTLSIGYTVTFGTGAISNSGLITIADGTHISVPSGGSFAQQSGGSITTTGAGYLDDSGGLTIGGGTMSGDPVHLESSGTLAYAVANPSQAGTSSDVIRYGGSGVTGTLSGDIPVGHTLTIATTSYTNAELNASAPYTNYGTIQLTSATNYNSSTDTLSGSALTNVGTIDVQNGDGKNGDCCGSRTISSQLTDSGKLQVDSGIRLTASNLTNVSGSKLTGGTYDLAGTLSASNATQSITENAAHLIVRSGGSFGNLALTTNDAGGELDVNSTTFTVPGALANAGTVSLVGGSLAVTGDYTQSGGSTSMDATSTLAPTGKTSLMGGTLGGAGTIASDLDNQGGLIKLIDSAGSPAGLAVTGAYTQSSGTLETLLTGTGAGRFSTLAVTKAAAVGGTLQIDTGAGYTPTGCSSYPIVSGASESGSFGNVTGATPATGVRYIDSYPATGVTLTAATAPDAPSAVQAQGGDGQASVRWTAPADHCSALTSYTLTAHPDGVSGTGSDVTKTVTAPAGGGTITGLTNGTTYDVTVLATNGVGGGPASSPAAQVTPLAAPVTSITGGPVDGTSIDTGSATFTYGSSESPSTFECKLDRGAFASCPSTGDSLSGLSDGQHTFTVEALNANGTPDAAPPSRTFTVDTVSPALSLSTIPSPGSNNRPTFSGTGGHAAGDRATVTLTLFPGSGTSGTAVGSALTANVNPSTGAFSAQPSNALSDGTYTVQASQSDQAGNTSTKTQTFVVDTAAPALSVTGGPADGSTITTSSATFTFTPGSDAVSVQCTLDGGTARACSGSGQDALSGLSNAQHTWSVSAKDAAGNTATVTRTFTVAVPAPQPAPTPTSMPHPATPAQAHQDATQAASGLLSGLKHLIASSSFGSMSLTVTGNAGDAICVYGAMDATKGTIWHCGPVTAHAVEITATIATVRHGKRHRVKLMILASGAHLFTKSGAAAIKINLSRAARRILKPGAKVSVTIATIYVPAGGKPVLVTRHATLTVPEAKKHRRHH